MTFACQVYGAKYVKCNSSHKIKYYREMIWCCKVNFKTNPSRLETKKEKPCLYSFKCINYKEEHQVDSNYCPFWKHCFNKE